MKPLSCEQARQLLGASRRDDWTTEDLTALGQHLESCPACRKAQAEYREVGELVRQLPSMVPPSAFRARVYAAIEADQQRIRRRQAHGVARQPAVRPARRPAAVSVAALARVAGAETDPALTAIRVRGAATPRVSLQRRVIGAMQENTRIVAALAAMLLVALLGATLVPASPFFLFGSSSSVTQYTADGRIAHVSAASASTNWLAYAGPAASGGGYLLFAHARQGGATIPLTNTPSAAPIAIDAVTGHWAIWTAGDASGWHLVASMLPSGETTTLLDSTASGSGAPVALHGVWASGDRVLAAVQTRGGSGLVVQFDLSSGVPAAGVVMRAAPGFQLANPSFDGTTYYWANVAQDGNGALHSTIWRGTDASHAQQVSADDNAFHPIAAHGTSGSALIWLTAGSAPMASNAGIDAALNGASGAVEAQDLASGQQTKLGAGAVAGSLQADGTLVLWQSGGKTYTYDLGTHAPSRIDSQIRNAAVATLSDSALTWAPANATTLDVYNLQ